MFCLIQIVTRSCSREALQKRWAARTGSSVQGGGKPTARFCLIESRSLIQCSNTLCSFVYDVMNFGASFAAAPSFSADIDKYPSPRGCAG
jgi:hypothetical protein